MTLFRAAGRDFDARMTRMFTRFLPRLAGPLLILSLLPLAALAQQTPPAVGEAVDHSQGSVAYRTAGNDGSHQPHPDDGPEDSCRPR